MVQGVVNARIEATVILEIRGPSGQAQEIEAVVDTGFSEYLIVGIDMAQDLRLESAGVDYLVLADGSVEAFDVFNVTVIWDGQPRHVEAYSAAATPLLGMGLLHEHDLHVEVVEGGRVTIEARA